MLRISQTGIRDGEFITSSSSGSQNRGTVIQIRGFYPPSISYVESLDKITLRDTFNNYDFFKEMTPTERKMWLVKNGTENSDLYMDDVNLSLKFVKIGGSFFTQELVDTLIKGKDKDGYWPIKEVYNMFPKKPNSKAKKHTLIFRPSNWSLMFSQKKNTQFHGLYIDINTGTIQEENVKNYVKKVGDFVIIDGQPQTDTLTWETTIEIAEKVCLYPLKIEMNNIRLLLSWFTPSLLKSLLQKLIRTRCEKITHNYMEYDAVPFLLTTLSMLLLHPGAFVPNIQRFVSGLESASKRLAISICEDSYYEDFDCILTMFAAASIAQDDSGKWMPSNELIMKWMKAAISAQQDRRSFMYNWRKFECELELPQVHRNSPLWMSYILLSEVKSFDSDIKMVGSIAQNCGKANAYLAPLKHNLNVMPLIHCVDQHSFTEIALYMKAQPFSETFRDIWNKVVGVNPRFEKHRVWIENRDVKDIRTAQRLIFLSKVYTPKVDPNIHLTNEMYSFTYKLDDSWLAGLVGSIEVKVGHVSAIVVIKCDDIYNFIAIKRPSRDTKSSSELTEDEKMKAIKQVKHVLSNGVKLHNVPSTLSTLQGATIYYHQETEHYEVLLANRKKKRWEELVNMKFQFPIFDPTFFISIKSDNCEKLIEYVTLNTNDCIMEYADQIIEKIFRYVSKSVLNRLLTYLEGNKSTISMFKISRDGSGVEYTVLPEDANVLILLHYICYIYPAALSKVSSNSFKVKCGPLLWRIKEKLIDALKEREIPLENVKWRKPKVDNRKLWEHQKDILASMIAKNKKGVKGHEIWSSVGSGKSLIILMYINYLILENKMPSYCVYTLPPSAVNSIKRELDMMSIPYQLLDMTRKSKVTSLCPNTVNLVLHDHMRLGGLDLQMKNVASDMLFIVDEFHKTMNKTHRTSIALEVVRLSADFIALSGTIIKDTNLEDLTVWLSQVVMFEVTERNYFTALSALISKKVQTNIVVDRTFVEAEISDKEYYYSLVPKTLGGTSDRLHFKEALAVCYKAITHRMIQEAIFYVKKGKKVFMVAKDNAHQKELESLIHKNGIKDTFLITSKQSIVLTPQDDSPIKVVITTIRQSEGYTLTDRYIGIYCVCLSNLTTRDQMDGRMNRIGQPNSTVYLVTIHAGILSYILKRYETARNLSEALKGFAQDINITLSDDDRKMLI